MKQQIDWQSWLKTSPSQHPTRLYNCETIPKKKHMLKRRKESGTYLATDSRHRWSAQMTMKNDN